MAVPQTSLDLLVPSGARGKGLSQEAAGGACAVSRAIGGAPRQRCPNAPARWVMNVRTEKTHRLACGRWSCPVCGSMKSQAARLAVEQGIRYALSRGERVRFATLTEDPARPLDLPALGAAWNRLRTTLKDSGLLKEYVAVVETTKAGRLHLHIVATGKYIPVGALRNAARNAGFGKVTDIRALGGKHTPKGLLKREELVGVAAHYVAKYLASESKRREALDSHVRVRLRPVRFSRGWGASLGSARADLIAQWREERGEAAVEPHRDDVWLMILRTERGILRVFRGREQIDPGDVDLLVLGITPMSDLLPRQPKLAREGPAAIVRQRRPPEPGRLFVPDVSLINSRARRARR